MQSPVSSPWKSDADAVDTTATLFADFSLKRQSYREDSSTDSAQTPVGWGGSSLEPSPRTERASDPSFRTARPSHGSLQNGRAVAGRSRGKALSRAGYRRLWNQVTSRGLGAGQGSDPPAELTVEDLVAVIQKLPGDAPVVPAVVEGLWLLDSRAAAALLKDLSKVGLTQRAFELFDWLRELPPTHELSSICDVFTYTTGDEMPTAVYCIRRAICYAAHGD